MSELAPEGLPRLIGLRDCGYYHADFLNEVEKELQIKAFTVTAGLTEFSKAEHLAYQVLKSQGLFRCSEVVITDVNPSTN